MKNRLPTQAQVKQATKNRGFIVYNAKGQAVAIYAVKRKSSLRDDTWDDNHQD